MTEAGDDRTAGIVGEDAPADEQKDGSLSEALDSVKATLAKEEQYLHAASLINFDQETVCPPKAMEEEGALVTMLSNLAFRLRKDPDFIREAAVVIAAKNELSGWDRVLAETLERSEKRERNLTPEKQQEFSEILQQSFLDWLAAKEGSDFGRFLPSLEKVRAASLEEISLRVDPLPAPYDNLLDDYERGMTTEKLDAAFERCRQRLLPLLARIMQSKKRIRTDFLSRRVAREQQSTFARYLLETVGFDFSRGTFAESEHPFTDGIGRDDTRVTTHFYDDLFASNLYSIVHEGGHAIFDQNTPPESRAHFVSGNKTMGMHESVSRFYENVLGRSEAFIHLIYPRFQEIFEDIFSDVSERELYEAVNLVQPSLIRTEADEFTYTLHIMIRYELEKEIIAGKIPLSDLPEIWGDRYEKYLGVRPQSDAEGVLQDVHWNSGFGYFPTYALGNMYNAMYFARMKEELDVDALVRDGDFAAIREWLTEHVFAKADCLDAASWIKDITREEFSPDPFLDYLEEKYSKLYELA